MLKSVLCQRVKCYKSSVRQLTSEDQTEREKIPTQSGKLAWSRPRCRTTACSSKIWLVWFDHTTKKSKTSVVIEGADDDLVGAVGQMRKLYKINEGLFNIDM